MSSRPPRVVKISGSDSRTGITKADEACKQWYLRRMLNSEAEAEKRELQLMKLQQLLASRANTELRLSGWSHADLVPQSQEEEELWDAVSSQFAPNTPRQAIATYLLRKQQTRIYGVSHPNSISPQVSLATEDADVDMQDSPTV